MQSRSYADRLKLLGIESLQTRRCFFDLIEVYKILNNLTSLGPDQLFTYDLSQRTRGHNFKLKKVHCRLDCRKHFFANRVIGLWNSLPDEIVNSTSLYSFKKRAAKYLRENSVSYFTV